MTTVASCRLSGTVQPSVSTDDALTYVTLSYRRIPPATDSGLEILTDVFGPASDTVRLDVDQFNVWEIDLYASSEGTLYDVELAFGRTVIARTVTLTAGGDVAYA